MPDLAPSSAAADAFVRVAGLNKWYGEFHALCDVDLAVAAGERVVLWGRSGSGKSTLVRCIAGLERFEAGAIEIGGERFGAGASQDQRGPAGVAMVFQSFNLFPHLRVIDNLTLGPIDVQKMPRQEARDLAMRNLEKVRMAEFAERYPGRLSGGQQQRVAIARALCMRPRLMLFDEPTSALDPELKKEVRDVMIGLAEDGMTMIVVTHERAMAFDLAQRMVLIDDGCIVRECAPAEFFAAATGEGANRAEIRP